MLYDYQAEQLLPCDHCVAYMPFFPSLRAFIVWLAYGDTLRVFKMTKKEDGTFTYIAIPEEFPKQHKAPIINIGVADTGMKADLPNNLAYSYRERFSFISLKAN